MTDFNQFDIPELYFRWGYNDREIFIIKKELISLENIQDIINEVNEYTEYLTGDYERSKKLFRERYVIL